MKTRIVNPMYDLGFKYLMADFETASYVFSLLLEAEVTVLNFLATEFAQSKDIPDDNALQGNRLDFVAEIKIGNERKKVIVELQKSSYFSSISRFSDYLGQQYSKREQFSREDKNPEQLKSHNLPIVPIYFLSKNLGKIKPMFAKVERSIKDIETGKKQPYNHDNLFIETLSHDMIVVQLAKIADSTWYQNIEYQELTETERLHQQKLRQFFKLFDQDCADEKNSYELLVETDELDIQGNKAAHRLSKALEDKQMQYALRRQQEFEHAFEKGLLAEQLLPEALKREEEERQQKEEALQREEEERQKNIVLHTRLKNIAKTLLKADYSIEEVMEQTGLSKEEVENI